MISTDQVLGHDDVSNVAPEEGRVAEQERACRITLPKVTGFMGCPGVFKLCLEQALTVRRRR